MYSMCYILSVIQCICYISYVFKYIIYIHTPLLLDLRAVHLECKLQGPGNLSAAG
jgi:hypothetical protein